VQVTRHSELGSLVDSAPYEEASPEARHPLKAAVSTAEPASGLGSSGVSHAMRIAYAMSHLRCPRCGLGVYQRFPLLTVQYCPRCISSRRAPVLMEAAEQAVAKGGVDESPTKPIAAEPLTDRSASRNSG
jgi:hypothetical protein